MAYSTVPSEVVPYLFGIAAVGAMTFYIRRHRDFIREDGVGLLFVFLVAVLAAKWLIAQIGGTG